MHIRVIKNYVSYVSMWFIYFIASKRKKTDHTGIIENSVSRWLKNLL